MKLALLGDIALFGNMSISKNPDWKEYFSEAAQFLSDMNYVVGNLETPFSKKKKTFGAKSAYICSDVENVEILKYLHIYAVTLANNHIFDYGKEGYETTKRLLVENGIDWFGTEGKGLIVDKLGNKLALEGFCCYSSNPLQCVPYGEYGVNEFDVVKANSVLKSHTDKGYLPIVAVHAGIEHVNYPSMDTIKVAKSLSEGYPYIYYGHHPHVLQSVEKQGDSLVAYSLGNFCFDDVYSSASKEPLIQLSENNRTTCILVVEIENNKIMHYELVPVYIGNDRMKVNYGTGKEDIERYAAIMVEKQGNEYNSMRNRMISEYIEGRKQKRNLMWYLKRMRPRYYLILRNAKKNRLKYIHCVTNSIANK